MTQPAVLYAAKSTEDRHGSIPTQLDDCRAMAEREGWTIVGEHSDEGFSAYKGNRGPGLAAAREAAARAASAASNAILVVQHSDRLARGAGDAPGAAEHLAELFFTLRRQGVQLRSVQDDQTFSNPMLVAMMGERNTEDSKRKAAAVRAGMKRRAERGEFNGGPPPYGYRWAGPKGERKLAVHEPEAVIVRRAFRDFIAGKSQLQICRELNAEGVTSQRGREWHQGTLAKYLANPVHMGSVRLNGEVLPGNHPAIVSSEDWQQAAALREAQARSPGRQGGRPPKGGHLFVKGMLRCGRCGGAMIPRTYDDHTGEPAYAVYRCYTRIRNGTGACSQEPIKREAIDGAVFEYFASSVLDMEATRAAIAAAAEGKLREVRALLRQAEVGERKARESLERIRGDYKSGGLPITDWIEFRDELTEEIAGAAAEVQRLRSHEARITSDAAIDADSDTLRYLGAIRDEIIGTVRRAAESRGEGVEAVRTALLRLFDGFTLRHLTPMEQSGVWVETRMGDGIADRDVIDADLIGVGPGGRYELVPHVKESAIAGHGPRGITPIACKSGLSGSGNNSDNGLQT